MQINQRVKLKSFNGKLKSDDIVHEKENYWKLIDKKGQIIQDPSQKNIYADFSNHPRVLVKFDDDIKSLNLHCHNSIANSLWILEDDLMVVPNKY